MANGSISLGTTTNVTSGVVSSTAFAKWVIACFVAGHIVAPDDTLLLAMCGALMPFGHLLYLGFAEWFSKKTGVQLPPSPLASATPGNQAP